MTTIGFSIKNSRFLGNTEQDINTIKLKDGTVALQNVLMRDISINCNAEMVNILNDNKNIKSEELVIQKRTLI